jgi:chorismate-pyruvate lyase
VRGRGQRSEVRKCEILARHVILSAAKDLVVDARSFAALRMTSAADLLPDL